MVLTLLYVQPAAPCFWCCHGNLFTTTKCQGKVVKLFIREVNAENVLNVSFYFFVSHSFKPLLFSEQTNFWVPPLFKFRWEKIGSLEVFWVDLQSANILKDCSHPEKFIWSLRVCARMRKTDLPRIGLKWLEVHYPQWGQRLRIGEKFLCCASRKRDDLKGASRRSRRRGRRSSRTPRRRTTQDGEASHERRRQRPDVTQPTLAWRSARKARILPSFGWKNGAMTWVTSWFDETTISRIILSIIIPPFLRKLYCVGFSFQVYTQNTGIFL